MCFDGGGESQVYRPLLPLNPDGVIWCCCKPVILNYLSFAFIDHSIVFHPFHPIPEQMFDCNILYRHKSFVCQDKTSFCNTGQLRDLPFLAQLPIDTCFTTGTPNIWDADAQ